MLFLLAFLYTFQTDLNCHITLMSMYHNCFEQLQEPERKISLSYEQFKEYTKKK